MKTASEITKAIETTKPRSAWAKGVKEYALELLEFCELNGLEPTEKNMLNGAKDWKQYSWTGKSLIYNQDIAERLCNQSELKRADGGNNRPNINEEWLDVQARALHQAALLIRRA